MLRRSKPLWKSTRPRGGYAPTRSLVSKCEHEYKSKVIDNVGVGLRYTKKWCPKCRHTEYGEHERYTPTQRRGEEPRAHVAEMRTMVPPLISTPAPVIPKVVPMRVISREEVLDQLERELLQVQANVAAYAATSRVRR